MILPWAVACNCKIPVTILVIVLTITWIIIISILHCIIILHSNAFFWTQQCSALIPLSGMSLFFFFSVNWPACRMLTAFHIVLVYFHLLLFFFSSWPFEGKRPSFIWLLYTARGCREKTSLSSHTYFKVAPLLATLPAEAQREKGKGRRQHKCLQFFEAVCSGTLLWPCF